MDPGKIFQIITNSTLLATRLLSGGGSGVVEFSHTRYCVVVGEDSPIATTVVQVTALHRYAQPVRYSITGGNRDGIFTIDHRSGLITLAAALNFELQDKHELVVAAEATGSGARTLVLVKVVDANDQAPYFLNPDPQVTVIEEDDRDLPAPIIKVDAVDEDLVDGGRLLYTISGDGVDDLDPSDAFFSVDSQTGEVIQLRPLDRDPPHGKSVWKVRVQVRDGLAAWGHQERREGKQEFLGRERKQEFLRRENKQEFLSRQERRESKQEFLGHQRRESKQEFLGVQERRDSKQDFLGVQRSESKQEFLGYQERRDGKQEFLAHQRRETKQEFFPSSHPKAPRQSHHHLLTHQDKRLHHYDPQAPERPKGDDQTTTDDFKSLVGGRWEERSKFGDDQALELWPSHIGRETADTVVLASKKAVVNLNVSKEIPVSHTSLQSRRGLQYIMTELSKEIDGNSPSDVVPQQYIDRETDKRELSDIQRDSERREGNTADESNGQHIRLSSLTSRESLIKSDQLSRLHHGAVSDPRQGQVEEGSSPLYWGREEWSRDNTGTQISRPWDTGRYPTPDEALSGVMSASDDTLERRDEDLNIKRINLNLIKSDSCTEDLEGKNEQKTEFKGNYFSPIVGNGGQSWTSPSTSGRPGPSSDTDLPVRRQPPFQHSKTGSSLLKPSGAATYFMEHLSSTRVKETPPGRSTEGLNTVLGPPQDGTLNEVYINYFPGENRSFQADIFHVPEKQEENSTDLDGFIHNKSDLLERIKRSEKGEPPLHNISNDKQQTNTESLTMPQGKAPKISEKYRDSLMTSETSSSAAGARDGGPVTSSTLPGGEERPSDGAIQGASTLRDVRSPNFIPQGLNAGSATNFRVSDGPLKGLDAGSATPSRASVGPLKGLAAGSITTSRYTRAPDSTLKGHNNIPDSPKEKDDQCEDFFLSQHDPQNYPGGVVPGGDRGGGGYSRRVHVVETVVMVVVKDINDNPPIFPTSTMFGQVKENGPKDVPVALVSAWDPDDPGSRNAQVSYAIEKNVIDESTGEAIFGVDPESGVVRTTRCCLDRETTPEYTIQVVATDGGGLKGTGTVVVRLSDENDNSPRLVRRLWETTVDETTTLRASDPAEGGGSLLELTLVDPDTHNHFLYRIVERSGWGWQLFGIRTVGSVGCLYERYELDYEDQEHRRGFRFLVQVTDKGAGGWSDPRHTDSAWVKVDLNDLNDNPPLFPRPHTHVAVGEDALPGTLLATFPARDPDMGGQQGVDYRVEGAWAALGVDEGGGVRLARGLDREGPQGPVDVALILAVDRGHPRLTSTATLSLTILDVNDCPPRLVPPTRLHVQEGAPASYLGPLRATDEDQWALGHGPPFAFSLASTNPPHVLDSIDLRFDPHLDSGRGGAELWTSVPLDREEHRELLVSIVLADAQGLSATTTATVVLDDLNDNPMRPASKTVYLWKTQGVGREAPLGRVYVDDPDDWDLDDKSFRWAGHPHPLFSLDAQTGAVTAAPHLRKGRYDLHFAVNDRRWGQVGVQANMTVLVKDLSPKALRNAVHVTLTPTTPEDLAKGWTPTGGGGVLGRFLLEVLKSVEGGPSHSVEVVSVYGESLQDYQSTTTTTSKTVEASSKTVEASYRTVDASSNRLEAFSNRVQASSSTGEASNIVEASSNAVETSSKTVEASSNTGEASNIVEASSNILEASSSTGEASSKTVEASSNNLEASSNTVEASYSTGEVSSNTLEASIARTSVWFSIREAKGGFMDPIKVQGLLALHIEHLEAATGLLVALQQEERAQVGAPGEGPTLAKGPQGPRDPQDPSSATSLASTILPLQVVDTNSTALVTPRLTHARTCPAHAHAHDPSTCTPNTCLNGGRCVRSHNGNRCVCPGGSWGPRCKVLGRSFLGEGWVWLHPLPPCLPSTISFRILTRSPEAILLYSGPLASSTRPPATQQGPPSVATPLLVLQLEGGRPQVVLEGPGGPLKLEVNSAVNDGGWHTLHLRLDPHGVGVMVDLCGRGWDQEDPDDAHCVARAAWTRPGGRGPWVGGWPLQVGGLAHTPPRPETQGWSTTPTPRPLTGCLSHLRVNGQLLDLGEAPYQRGTTPGCRPQETACPGGCGHRGECLGGLHRPQCQCHPGWAGSGCTTPTTPVTLGSSSFLKMALSFTPPPRTVTAQVRIRTIGVRQGLLLRLAQRQHNAAFALHLRAGVACVSVSGVGWVAREACVEGRPLGDGSWHTLTAERHGDNLVVSVDDQDDWRRNESLASLEGRAGGGRRVVPPTTLEVDKHDGVTVGGLPEFVGVSLVTVHHDLHDVCLDDLRVCGRPLPLPPSANGTTWGQVTTLAGLEAGCTVDDPCYNTTCNPPLTCTPGSWGQPACRCGPGRELVGRTCVNVNECTWGPCLHGGTCVDQRAGYTCLCGPGHTGDHCQWARLATQGHPLTGPLAMAAITLSLLLVVFGVLLSLRLHRLRSNRNVNLQDRNVNLQAGGETGTITSVEDEVGGRPLEDEGGLEGGGILEVEVLEARPGRTTYNDLQEEEESSAKATTDHDFLELLKFSQQKRTGCRAPGDVSRAGSAQVTGQAPPPTPGSREDDLGCPHASGEDGSPSSMTSTISGHRGAVAVIVQELGQARARPLRSGGILEALDLLRNLPGGTTSSSSSSRTPRASRTPLPAPKDTDVLGSLAGPDKGTSSRSPLPGAGPASPGGLQGPKDLSLHT